MGKRSKAEKIEVRTMPKNPVLKRLMSSNGDNTLSTSLLCTWDGYSPNERLDNITTIVAATGADINRVITECQGLRDDELREVANEAEQVYSEIEIPVSFGSVLDEYQIARLLPIFSRVVDLERCDIESVSAIFNCAVTKPVRAKNNGLLAYLFSLLASENLICQNWQFVASERKVFCSSNGKVLTQKDLSKALSMYIRKHHPIDKEIIESVRGLEG